VSFQQADAVLAALAGTPTLLVPDDLHWADAESLRLLRRVAGGLAEVPAVVVVTSRIAAAEIAEPVADALAVLARLDPERIELGGLDAGAVSAWVTRQCGRTVGADVAAELTRRTDGNPFYLAELVRLLVSGGALGDATHPAWRAVPGGVRDVVRQRSRQLPPESLPVLTSAAVVGRSFDLEVLDTLIGDPAGVAEAIEGAQVLGLVDEEAPGRYRFTHALVRDALHESIPAPARARRHAEVAAALEEHGAGRVAELAADLAEHYRLAGPAHARSGWVMARRAAVVAADRSAYDEALRLVTLAGDLQGLDPSADDVEREELLVARARALTRVSRPVEAWEPAERAARLALARGDRDAAADALLTVTGGLVWGWRTHPEHDEDAIALWRQVRDLFSPEVPAEATTWALLNGALAAEHLYLPGGAGESTRLADLTTAVVHRSPSRGPAELLALRLAQMALLRPDLLHHRMPLSDEVVELAVRVGRPEDLAGALSARAQDRGELGRLDATLSDVLRAHELAERHHLSQNRAVSGWCLALRSAMEGRLEEAERAIRDNETFQATLAMSGNGIGMCQLSLVRDRQGRLPELEARLRELCGFHPGLRELHALAMVRAGRLEDLRLLLGPWSEQPPLLRDYLWLFLTALRAEVWAALRDLEACRELEAELAPYADRLAISVPVGFRGNVRLTLGRLAALRGDRAAAEELLTAARRVHEELGLADWVRITDADLAAL
jgi:tetratricopeptide (TPR) repeat protein